MVYSFILISCISIGQYLRSEYFAGYSVQYKHLVGDGHRDFLFQNPFAPSLVYSLGCHLKASERIFRKSLIITVRLLL